MGPYGCDVGDFPQKVVPALCKNGDLWILQTCLDLYDPSVWRTPPRVLEDGVCILLDRGRYKAARWLAGAHPLDYVAVARRVRAMSGDRTNVDRRGKLDAMALWCEGQQTPGPHGVPSVPLPSTPGTAGGEH